jgi:hypothetical protein
MRCTVTAVPRPSSDAARAAVTDRLRALPRADHRQRCGLELLQRILREGGAGMFLEQAEEIAGKRSQAEKIDLARAGGTALGQTGVKPRGKGVRRTFMHHLGEALHQAPVAVPGQTRIAGTADDRLDSDIVDPDIEHGLHHSGHRHRGAATHRDQQRPAAAAEVQPALALDVTDAFGQRIAQLGRRAAGRLQKMAGEAGRQNKSLRHRQTGSSHGRQVAGLEAHLLDTAGLGDRIPGADEEQGARRCRACVHCFFS